MIIGFTGVDGFVLVSDSDYTRLAVRLRESGRFSARNGRTPVLQWETPSVEEAHKPEVPIGIGTSRASPSGLVAVAGDQNEAVNVSSVKDIHSVDDHRCRWRLKNATDGDDHRL